MVPLAALDIWPVLVGSAAGNAAAAAVPVFGGVDCVSLVSAAEVAACCATATAAFGVLGDVNRRLADCARCFCACIEHSCCCSAKVPAEVAAGAAVDGHNPGLPGRTPLDICSMKEQIGVPLQVLSTPEASCSWHCAQGAVIVSTCGLLEETLVECVRCFFCAAAFFVFALLPLPLKSLISITEIAAAMTATPAEAATLAIAVFMVGMV